MNKPVGGGGLSSFRDLSGKGPAERYSTLLDVIRRYSTTAMNGLAGRSSLLYSMLAHFGLPLNR